MIEVSFMHCNCQDHKPDCEEYSPNLLVTNVAQETIRNPHYRSELWTGYKMQMTLMCIPVCSDIGLEIHEDTDQIIRVEQGFGRVCMGFCKDELNFQQNICSGSTIFIPAGTWHNVINTGRCPLKLSTLYAPPHHPLGTEQHTKADAQN